MSAYIEYGLFWKFLTWFKFSALKHFFVNNKLWFVWGFIPYLCAHLDGEEEREEEGIISVLLLMVCPYGIIKCYQISRLSLKVIVYFWVNHNFSDLPIVVKLNPLLKRKMCNIENLYIKWIGENWENKTLSTKDRITFEITDTKF